MNAVPLLLLYMFSKREGRGAEPRYPSPHHPPPRRARHALPHHAASHAHHSEHAAEQHQATHHATHSPAGKPFHNLDFSHANPADDSQLHHATRRAKPRGKPFKSLDFSHAAEPQHDAAPPPVHHEEPPAPETNDAPAAGYDIARLQRILVGLGWRGHLTTKGSVSPLLQDGLYGPVTHDDWQQSAHKRGLDTTFVRLGPRTAQVDDHTFEVLRDVARSMGASVDGRRRRMRIP